MTSHHFYFNIQLSALIWIFKCLFKIIKISLQSFQGKNRKLLTPLSHSTRPRGESVILKAADVELLKRNTFYWNILAILPSKDIAEIQHLKKKIAEGWAPSRNSWKNEYVLVYPQLGRDVTLRRKSHVSPFKLDSWKVDADTKSDYEKWATLMKMI